MYPRGGGGSGGGGAVDSTPSPGNAATPANTGREPSPLLSSQYETLSDDD